MKLTQTRKIYGGYRRTSGFLRSNAVLVSGMALPFVVVPTITLKAGVAISAAVLCSLEAAMIAASLIGERLPQWARIAVSVNVAMAAIFLIYPLAGLLSPQLYDAMGIYFCLAALNTMVLVRTESYAVHHTWYHSALDGLRYGGGFALVALVLSAVRELLGQGTLWGTQLLPFRLPAVQMVFFGFIAVGMMAAAANGIRRLLGRLLWSVDNPKPPKGKENSLEEVTQDA